MINAYLIRDDVTSECIRGLMSVDGHLFHILERPPLSNRRNQSCISSGAYVCRFMARSSSGKYKNVYWLQGVPGRQGILIHNGNTVNHTRGCLIIGSRRGILAGKRAVLNSRTALGGLYDIIGPNEFNLTILGDQKWT